MPVWRSEDSHNVHGHFHNVNINGIVIPVNGVIQGLSVLVLGFIAFNLKHSVKYEDIWEYLEIKLGIRKKATKSKVSNLL